MLILYNKQYLLCGPNQERFMNIFPKMRTTKVNMKGTYNTTNHFHYLRRNGVVPWKKVGLYSMMSLLILAPLPLHGFTLSSRITSLHSTKRSINYRLTHLQVLPSYGKGAEIWPETNEEPIRLEDTFPMAEVPQILDFMNNESNDILSSEVDTLDESDEKKPGRKRKIVKRAISNVLSGAARLEADKAQDSFYDKNSVTSSFPISGIDKSPLLIAISLVSLGLISFSELFTTIGLSSYLFLLNWWNTAMAAPSMSNLDSTTDSDSVRVVVPSLPPQGHVPSLVSNPLGHIFTNSPSYRIWLKTGAIGGVFLPLIAMFWYLMKAKDNVAAGLVARPIFLICCQAISEGVCRKVSFLFDSFLFLPYFCFNIFSESIAYFMCPLWSTDVGK